ncbi:GABA transporter 1-like isoform X1 [Macadamia integrifolia]|uniref:GABA transporter 1-like isoform X1 n=1 Tax=Macadamia integrifolia TaxID=60698 RepID=UPI001C4EEFA2|nr:GABA transporter 1-like isoform X1 [Macadamia integrifolia]
MEMGTLHRNSVAAQAGEGEVIYSSSQTACGQDGQKNAQLDAGALFVLKSEGSWMHCGYHLTTSIVAPALLSLPYAFVSLGWIGGMVCLCMGAAVTFYSYNLISLVLEHHAHLGHRQLRFKDMADHILGPGWGRYFVGPIQFAVCYGAVIGSSLLGGECMKTIYVLSKPDGTMKLYEFITIFGCFMLILAQMPSFHSLRHINFISLLLCLAYSVCATAGAIYVGSTSKGPVKDYSITGDTTTKVFGVFSAIAIIATTYGNGIIPEIQATLAPPVKGKMFKGLLICYIVVMVTFFSVAIAGYWAFGNQSASIILSNFIDSDTGKTLVPKWFLMMTNIFTLLQLGAVGVVYLQPTNEVLESTFGDPKSPEFSMRNVVPRLISRSLAVVTGTILAAMLPFFGDINALIGAFGFLPLDFVMPVVFYNFTFRPSIRSPVFWLNTTIAVVFGILVVLGSIASVRQIVIDANSYKLFANV